MRQFRAEGEFEALRTFRLPQPRGGQVQGENLRRFERVVDRGLYTEGVTKTHLLVSEGCCDMTQQGRIL